MTPDEKLRHIQWMVGYEAFGILGLAFCFFLAVHFLLEPPKDNE